MLPYAMLAKFGAIAGAVLAIFIGIGYYGHTQKIAGRAEVQARWDADRLQWQSALDKQKADAAALYLAAQQAAASALQANAELRAKQEQSDVQHKALTDSLRHDLGLQRLRYTVPAAPAGRGQGGGDSVPATGERASVAPATVVQLPDEIASGLRQLAYEADQVTDAYRKCYAFVYGMASADSVPQ